jgi:ribosome recycling factor
MRHFTSTPAFLYAKKKGGKKETSASKTTPDEEDGAAVEVVDFEDLKLKFNESVELFKEKVAIVRQGKFTPAVLEEIIVKTHDHTDEPLKNIARVASKGPRTLTITVFDPHNVKHITAAVIGSDLNLNPQPDPKSPEQVLRVPLPPATAESKKEIIKQLRHEYEHFRNSPAKKSLTGIREHALKAIKKTGKALSKDETFRVKNNVEDLFKAGAKSLADVLKQAETAALKE